MRSERLKYLSQLDELRQVSVRRHLLIALYFPNDIADSTRWIELLDELAATELYGKHIDFIVDDINQLELIAKQVNYASCNAAMENRTPLIYGITTENEVHFFGSFSTDEHVSCKSLSEFCKKLLIQDGTLQQKRQPASHIIDVDMANIEQTISSLHTDILLCFYDPPQHCMRRGGDLLRELQRLDKKLQNDELTIAKVGVLTKDKSMQFDVQAMPALYFLRQKDSQHFIRFESAQLNLLTLIKFVAEHATEDLIDFDRFGKQKLHAEAYDIIQQYFNSQKSFSK